MPAERWQSAFTIFQSIGDNDDEITEMFMSSMLSSFQKNDDASSAPRWRENEGQKFPDVLPILPLRGVVVYPNTAVPLTVGQARSIRLVDDVVGGDKLVGLVAALNPEQETPTA